tara:strand:- start:16077 stop:16340 length:264 start_codon:yes stop_codon:yes gene_type:complete
MDIEFYDFRQELGSVEWLRSLPNGMLSEKIDIRYSSVHITKLKNGYQVYVGPKNTEAGGDAITVTLDNDFKLIDYEIERIAHSPQFE